MAPADLADLDDLDDLEDLEDLEAGAGAGGGGAGGFHPTLAGLVQAGLHPGGTDPGAGCVQAPPWAGVQFRLRSCPCRSICCGVCGRGEGGRVGSVGAGTG